MSTVAEQLRQAREAKHLTVQQVAETIKIRSDHVRALEEGNFNVFSAPVYIRGFVRTYSTLLKLDVPRVMVALDGELGQTKKFAEPPPVVIERLATFSSERATLFVRTVPESTPTDCFALPVLIRFNVVTFETRFKGGGSGK